MADRVRPELPSTAEHPVLTPVPSRRPFGVRLWLALMFAAIGILSGTSVYLFVSGSSEGAAESRSQELAGLRTGVLAGQVEDSLRQLAEDDPSPRRIDIRRDAVGRVLARERSDAFKAWYVDSEFLDRDEGLVTTETVGAATFGAVPGGSEALETALQGDRVVNADIPGDQIVVAEPIAAGGRTGALLVLADRPPEVEEALQALQRERLTALTLAVIVAAIIGSLVASLITTRVKRLADDAGRLAQGRLDEPLHASGRDEIGDLGRTLDSMRIALRESFEALSSERDRLSAIFSALDDAVMVIGSDGDVRFANPAAGEYMTGDGMPIEALRPWVRRATHRGQAESDSVPLGERVIAVSARNLPAEGGALVVVHDRTEELRRDLAEREFVSNAAHELRNPIAGMSGAIEVLRSGAKDDPEAREHFLNRLADDVERTSRLTKSLLTLARMEAIGEGEAEVVGIELVIREALAAIDAPEGIEVRVDAGDDLVARGDPVLLRQVLVGLLSNAFKHTESPGVVTIRAHEEGSEDLVIEVEDSGEGIAPEDRDRVFERFYRGSGSLELEGFGLGLAIAKRMVNVMGGEISVSSEKGQGATFSVKLPQAEPSPTPIA